MANNVRQRDCGTVESIKNSLELAGNYDKRDIVKAQLRGMLGIFIKELNSCSGMKSSSEGCVNIEYAFHHNRAGGAFARCFMEAFFLLSNS